MTLRRAGRDRAGQHRDEHGQQRYLRRDVGDQIRRHYLYDAERRTGGRRPAPGDSAREQLVSSDPSGGGLWRASKVGGFLNERCPPRPLIGGLLAGPTESRLGPNWQHRAARINRTAPWRTCAGRVRTRSSMRRRARWGTARPARQQQLTGRHARHLACGCGRNQQGVGGLY